MPLFFSRRRGTVTRVNGSPPDNAPSPFAISIQGAALGPSFDVPAIITQGGLDAGANICVQHAADETIYAYIFGDRIGNLKIGGVAFASRCGMGSGLSTILDIYRTNRAAATGKPVLLMVGNNVTRALLTGLSFNAADAERDLAEWGFSFLGLAPLGNGAGGVG